MMRFLESGRDLSLALPGEYDLVLVILSVYAAVMAAYAAITLADRLRETNRPATRAAWLTAGAVALGGGVWTMHFIGMLAFRLPLEIGYEVWTTLASMLPAIFAAGVSLHIIIATSVTLKRLLIGGTFMGAGIGLMHYTGMAAMRLPGDMRYDPYLVALSVLVAVALASVSLYVRFVVPATGGSGFVQRWSRVISAVIMGLAISGMHYTAMLAVYFFPAQGVPSMRGLDGWVVSPEYLGTGIGITAGVIIGLLIVVIHETEMIRRQAMEQNVQQLNEDLEKRVAERTRALEAANEALRAYGDDLEAVNEFSSVLQSSATVDDACDAVRVFVGRLFPESSGSVYLSLGSDQYLQQINRWGERNSSEAIIDQAECWALRRGLLHLVTDPREDLVCPHVREGGTGACLCAPLMAQGRIMGMLFLEQAAWPEASRLPRMVQTLAEHISLALANIRLRDSLYRQSVRDPLTGLFNRRYLTETLARELAHAARRDKPLSVALIDVDHFKRFNDEHGHDAGDAILRQLAACLQGSGRTSDVVARYGGEEFVLVLLDAGREQARQAAEKIRRAVSGIDLAHDGRKLGPVTVSAGIAVFPEDAATPEELLEIADRNLYAAKRLGRDRVVDSASAA